MDMERQSVAVLQQLGRTYRAFTGAFEKRMGLPLPRWRILHALHHQEGAMGQKALADLVVMDPGALTRQLKVMQELGWIERSMSERDNRVLHVTLSPAGRQVVAHAMPLRSSFLEAALSEVSTTTLDELSRGLAQLEAGIAQAQRCAANQTSPRST
ncbi:putative transcriptional regulatory protein, MarR (plasmid) [Cupriavidus taiwanensis]|uniref:Transcriptional regulatory protein, MarR n=1 Tax=Cupriavidus taiwanensis TaxID=164546 RepID=A0A375HD18_9BURK|nr:MarR family transcriptional regulator [Cupriavidus taiwanensis]SOZ70871.1 putative transcriptional regulatory protein, MarR [Cupriavidus taiwanensis]SOZ72012.1 putative transcriptional regulatory protein, MarR [Cupriavidus taiwanensis]SOZ74359.1 putative transcriptional regulatory protein, MarR [Cupriavidus taiwanensis]SPA03266.1 putative transcriptional regulatory protein, MarR [Cupriavidus taiwanensis]SPA11246.1 putative transcriptional regulatory protein, MarR [Cupriavidus taiwanensis]